MTANNSEVSLVVPCHNETENLPALYARAHAVMGKTGNSWGMVCVNDGSTDDTLDQLLASHRDDPRVVVVDLSRNFGKAAALTAGLDHARGDCAIPRDADLQDPPPNSWPSGWRAMTWSMPCGSPERENPGSSEPAPTPSIESSIA